MLISVKSLPKPAHFAQYRLSAINVTCLFTKIPAYRRTAAETFDSAASLHVLWEQQMDKETRNSSGDEIANVNFLYDDIVHALKIQ